MGAVTKAELEARVARLEKSLTEALEREKATGEILGVISHSPTDTQAVFDTIVRTGLDLFSGATMSLRLVKGDYLETVASTKPIATDGGELRAPVNDDRYMTGRSIRSKEVLHIPDVDAEDWLSAQSKERARQRGYRAVLHAPMLRGGEAIGTVVLTRPTPGRFTDKEIALLTTFADQAVIAIENARLFTETREALEQQTATAEILKVISSSPTDVQPVFDVIAERATQLCDGNISFVFTFDGEWIHLAAPFGLVPEAVESVRKMLPMRPGGHSIAARTVRDGTVVHIPDVLADPEYRFADAAKLAGYRSGLGVPMLSEGGIVGGIVVARADVGLFSE
jgi:GAF domain-containing protein